MPVETSTARSTIAPDDPRLKGLDEKSKGKLRAAYAAVDKYIKDGQAVGIGSGSTIVFAVQRLAERVKAEGLTLRCVPTSFQARDLILSNNLPLCDLNAVPKLDVAIDGADEVSSGLNCTKGGGGCLVQEKIVAAAAATFVIIADNTKISDQLGVKFPRIPVEVIPMAYKSVALKIEAMGADVQLRMAKSKAGPCVTDNSNFILDVSFGALSDDKTAQLDQAIHMLPGVVDTGFFVNMASEAFFGGESEELTVMTRH